MAALGRVVPPGCSAEAVQAACRCAAATGWGRARPTNPDSTHPSIATPARSLGCRGFLLRRLPSSQMTPQAALAVAARGALAKQVEVLPEERKPTLIGFLSRALPWFEGQGNACPSAPDPCQSFPRDRNVFKLARQIGLSGSMLRPRLQPTALGRDRRRTPSCGCSSCR